MRCGRESLRQTFGLPLFAPLFDEESFMVFSVWSDRGSTYCPSDSFLTDLLAINFRLSLG